MVEALIIAGLIVFTVVGGTLLGLYTAKIDDFYGSDEDWRPKDAEV